MDTALQVEPRPGIPAPDRLATAARALGIAYTTVCAMALRGELTSQTVADRVFIHRDSVERQIATRRAKIAS